LILGGKREETAVEEEKNVSLFSKGRLPHFSLGGPWKKEDRPISERGEGKSARIRGEALVRQQPSSKKKLNRVTCASGSFRPGGGGGGGKGSVSVPERREREEKGFMTGGRKKNGQGAREKKSQVEQLPSESRKVKGRIRHQ